MEHVCAYFCSTADQVSDSRHEGESLFSSFLLFYFLFFIRHASQMSHRDCFWMFTLNKTSQEFSDINFITRYCLIIMNYILYQSLLVSSPSKNAEENNFLNFDEMKHVSIVHVCSCLFCKKKDYIAMCVMFDKYTCFAARSM